MKFTVSGFAGCNQAVEPKLLPDVVGVSSVNCKPGRGDLRPWRQPLAVASADGASKTIYRMGRDVASDSQYWLAWSTVVHAVRGFIASDSTERTYYTGDGVPKVTDNILALATAPYPTAYLLLGVPKPSTVLTLTQSVAGTGTDELRYYVQTFVTDHGEESAPCAPVSITVKPGAIIDITGLPAAPANYGISKRRIYRTQAATSGTADFFFLREDLVGVTTGIQDDARALGADTLATNGWDMPPSDLRHLTVMWNGMMAGITGRSVRVCESYKPYAWPAGYETLTGDVTPVALAVWSQTLVILTTGMPYIVTGSIPGELGDEPLSDFNQACVSERSAVTVGTGVIWASPDGLAMYGTGGPRLLTSGLMLREDWQKLRPQTIIGCQYEGAYLGIYSPTDGVLKAFFIDPSNPTGIYFLDTGYPAVAFDKYQDTLYVLDGGSIKKWDADTTFMTATFKSKVFKMLNPVCMAVLEVVSKTYPVTVKVYSDKRDTVTGAITMELRDTRAVTSSDPVTIRGGYLSSEFQVEISTAGDVQAVNIAECIEDLMGA